MINKLTDNDPKLTAYALGELTRNEAEEMAKLLNAGENAAMKREVESIDDLGVMLTQVLSATSTGAESEAEPQIKLSAAQRDAIFRSAKAPTVNDVSSANQSRWLRPVVVTLGAVALVTFSFIMLDNIDGDEPSIAALPDTSFSELSEDELNAPILPNSSDWTNDSNALSVSSQTSTISNKSLVPGGMKVSGDVADLVKLVENDWVSRADSAVARMPMICGKASWKWVSHNIVQKGALPDKNVVRVEEILNAFDYNFLSALELKHASAGVDLVRCPWNDDNLIALIVVENKHQDKIQIESAVCFSSAVNQYRVVGYAKAAMSSGNLEAPAKVTMSAGDAHLVMYEIVPELNVENAVNVLSLDIRTAAAKVAPSDALALEYDAKTLDVLFSERAYTKASQDMQFALIMASWSQLLSNSSYDSAMHASGVQQMIESFEVDFSPTTEQAEAIEVLKKGIRLL